MANLQRNQLMQQMQREQSDMEMNGHRPQSPSSAENAPSPSKRPRLDNGPMNGQQLAPNGRGQGQGMPGQPNPMMVQNGLTRQMTPQAQAAFQQSGPGAQQKSIQVYAQNLALHHSRSAMNNQGMPNGLMNPGVMPNQTDLVPMPDGQGMSRWATITMARMVRWPRFGLACRHPMVSTGTMLSRIIKCNLCCLNSRISGVC